MLIKDFCTATGLPRETVRFYVRRGLLRPQVGTGTGNCYQVFDRAMVERVRLIRAAQSLGFTLQQIGELARAYEQEGLDAQRKAQLLRERVAQVDAQAAQLAALRGWLQAKLRWVEAGEHGEPPALPARPDGPLSRPVRRGRSRPAAATRA